MEVVFSTLFSKDFFLTSLFSFFKLGLFILHIWFTSHNCFNFVLSAVQELFTGVAQASWSSADLAGSQKRFSSKCLKLRDKESWLGGACVDLPRASHTARLAGKSPLLYTLRLHMC